MTFTEPLGILTKDKPLVWKGYRVRDVGKGDVPCWTKQSYLTPTAIRLRTGHLFNTPTIGLQFHQGDILSEKVCSPGLVSYFVDGIDQ